MRATEVAAFYDSLAPAEREAIDQLIAADAAATPWRPLIDLEHPEQPTPQRLAFDSPADVLLYGGAAGGGKSSLICGLATTAHRQSLLLRREVKQAGALVDEIGRILRTTDGWNSQKGRWTLGAARFVDIGGCANVGDEQAWQGRPHDLLCFDELAQFQESQFRYLLTWNRSTDPSQRCRVVCTSNPPTTAEGEWIKSYWSPWLDASHLSPAALGELRWFVSDEDGKDREVDGPEPVQVGDEMVQPRSRTFIPSSVDDNPFLAGAYKATLQSLPEPLRSQMLRGDFLAGGEDNPWQVIPTAWIKAAQDRWQETAKPRQRLDALGVDPSRGGRDETVIAKRYNDWFDQLIIEPGQEVPDGPTAAALVIAHLRDGAPAFVDIIGIGSSVFDHLKGNNVHVVAVNSAEASGAVDRSGKLRFANKRSELWWKMREALEDDVHPLCLPPDPKLLADLAAPRWKLTVRGVQVESKPDIAKRLGRSTDRGDAVVYALQERLRKDSSNYCPPADFGNYDPLRFGM